MMNPVHAIGVFHDQNGSTCASVAASDTIMIARPTLLPSLFTAEVTEECPSSCNPDAVRTAAQGGRADAFAEDQHFVRAAEAPRHDERLEVSGVVCRICHVDGKS